MTRTPVTTPSTARTPVTTNSTARQGITFIMTELLDFLTTEDDKYLITDESVFSEYTARTKPTTSYN
jgi:hypothetical protein